MHQLRRIIYGVMGVLLLGGAVSLSFAQQPTLQRQGTYETNIFDEGAAEIATFDLQTGYLLFVNSDANEVVALDISDPTAPTQVYTIDVEQQVTGGSANSVDVYNGTVAVAVEGANTTDNGFAIFYNATNGNFISRAQVGIMPDNLSFNGDGTAVVTANEGEPVDDYSTDPEGTVSVVDVSDITTPSVATADFTAFNSQRAQLISEGVRIFGNAGRTELDVTNYNDTDPATLEVTDASAASEGDWLTIASAEDPIAYQIESISGTTLTLTDEFDGDTDLTEPGDLATYLYDGESTVAEDLEPEYVAIDGTTAYVSLQENNAIAEVDVSTVSSPTVTDVYALGTKDHSVAGNGLDPSKEDGPGGDPEVNIETFPLQGLYQPDAIASVTIDGTTYLLTANEGDAREYDGFVGETSIDALQFDSALNTNLQDDAELGDLATPITLGDTDGDGEVEDLYAYGARSFSIWNPANFDGSADPLVYDSGDFFEQKTAELFPADFNANNDENNSLDDRSDNKGPEPEAVEVGVVNGTPYAFIGLERIGGVMVFDISTPTNPTFVEYVNNRDFGVSDVEASVLTDGAVGDLGPESIVFIPAADNPNSNTDLLVVSNEVSGTVSLYTFATPPPPALLISEVADPGDEFEGRFVELYNGSNETIDLAAGDWHLSRQANGGNFGDIELTGTLAPGELYIVARSGSGPSFQDLYGFAPDVESGFISGTGNDGYFLYQGGDHSTGTLVDAYGVIDQDGSGEPWDYKDSRAVRNAGVTAPTPTWTASEWTITPADVADMTPGNTVLPVELAAFTGTADASNVVLTWQTASETNNAGFHIEHRSPNAEAFERVGFRAGNGTTTEAQSYRFRLTDVTPGTHRFRLRQVDTDGTQSLSHTIAVQVTLTEAFTLSSATPNPFRTATELTLAVQEAQAVQVELYNLLGQRVATLFDGTARPEAPTRLTVDGQRLSSGTYFVRVHGEQFQATRKVMVVR